MRIGQALLACTAVAMLVACGVPRSPLPPSLHLPRPAQDLEASRKGDKVTLTWTVPEQSTDQELLRKHLGLTRVCRQVGGGRMAGCSQPLAQLAPNQFPPPQITPDGRKLPVRATFTETIPKELQQQSPQEVAGYAVEILNTNGRSAGLSNMVEIPLAPIPAPPSDISAQVTSDAVVVRFSIIPTDGVLRLAQGPVAGGNASNYRVYRSLKGGGNFTSLGFTQLEDGKLRFDDKSFDWESSYEYKVTPVTWNAKGIELEGEDSKPIEVFTHDIFPPATPTGLQAVSSVAGETKFIDLTWAPNTESDLAGYNLYRRTAQGAMVKINTELISTPSFRDNDVVSGASYTYAVSAVDMRRNESPLSPEASEVVP